MGTLGNILSDIEVALAAFGLGGSVISKLLAGFGTWVGSLVSKIWGANADTELQTAIDWMENIVKVATADAATALKWLETEFPNGLAELEVIMPGNAQAIMAKAVLMRDYAAKGTPMPHAIASRVLEASLANVYARAAAVKK